MSTDVRADKMSPILVEKISKPDKSKQECGIITNFKDLVSIAINLKKILR